MAGDSAGGQEVGRVSIRVVPNLDRFYRDLKDRLEEIEKSLKAHIEVVPDMSGFREEVEARTRDLQDAHVKIKADVDHSSFLRARAETKGFGGGGGFSVGNSARELRAVGDGADYAGQQFLGLSRIGWIVTAVFAAAAPAIGLVSGLLAGLPSLLGAIAIPAGAVVLGMDGIKKALDNAGVLSEKQGKKGGKGKQTAGEQIKQLQAQVSDVFANGLTPVFSQLLTMMPILTSGFVGMAQQLVGLAKGFTDVVTSAGGMAQIRTIFGQIGNFIGAGMPALQAFTRTMLTLGADGAKNLNLLAAPLNKFFVGFDEMIGRVSKSGVLQSAFQGLSQTLGPLLNLFTKLFESGLKAMGQLGGPLGNLIDGLGNAVIALMPALTSLSSLIGNVFGALGTQLAPIITALTPAFTELATTLGTLLVSGLQTLGPVLTQIAQTLGTTMVTALAALQPMLPLIAQAFQQLGTAFSADFAQIIPQLAQGFVQLTLAIMPLLPQIISLATSGFQILAPLLAQSAPLIQLIVGGFTVMAGQISSFVGRFAELASGISQFAQALPAALAAGKQAFVQFAAESIATIVTFVGEAVAAVSGLGGKIAAACSNFGSVLVGAGKALIEGLINGITSMIGSAVSAAKNLAGQVAGAVKGALGIHSPSQVFHDLGENTAEGFQNGLEGGFQGVLDSAKSLAQQVSDAVASGTAGPQLAKQVKEQIQAIDIEKQKLKVDSDSTSDKGQKQAIKGQIDQLNIAKSQLGLSKDQLKTGGDSTKAQMDALSIQEQQLKAEYDATSDKGKRKDLKAQMDALKVQKDQLKLYQMQHPESKGKDKKSDDMGQMLAGQLNKAVDVGKNFAMANVKQFESDIGISGNGALPQLADMGLNWMQSMLGNLVTGAMGGGKGGGTQIHVNSVDEAFAAKQNMDNKQAHQFAGR
jgi:phage-related minor tail protein